MGGVDVGGGLAVDLHFDGLQIADAAFGQKRPKGGVKARRSPDAAVDGKGELRRRQARARSTGSACGPTWPAVKVPELTSPAWRRGMVTGRVACNGGMGPR